MCPSCVNRGLSPRLRILLLLLLAAAAAAPASAFAPLPPTILPPRPRQSLAPQSPGGSGGGRSGGEGGGLVKGGGGGGGWDWGRRGRGGSDDGDDGGCGGDGGGRGAFRRRRDLHLFRRVRWTRRMRWRRISSSSPGRVGRWARSSEGREDIFTYGISVAVACLLRAYVVEPRYIPSESMLPTFRVGDQLAVEKVSRRGGRFLRRFQRDLRRGDVIVFRPPDRLAEVMEAEYGGHDTSGIGPNEALIKRVVAVEGDRVRIARGGLYLNGRRQVEPYTNEPDRANYRYGPLVVPRGRVLCLGDNRNASLDGHIWGTLPVENVIGRAIFVYWPPWRASRKDGVAVSAAAAAAGAEEIYY